MKIKKLELYSDDLENQKEFYKNTLGFNLYKETSMSFSIRIGWSILTFKKSDQKHPYHYCFLIPSNKFDLAFDWLKNRCPLIEFKSNQIFHFEDWNAKSFYFYDGNGNVAECIVRYDLQNDTSGPFDIKDLLCINEIGTATANIKKTNNYLQKSIGTSFWKGNLNRFGTNGDNEGLFLLVNHEVKKIWFPTEVKTVPSPYTIEVESSNQTHLLRFAHHELNLI